MIGQLQLCETFANSVMVFNDHFFSDDTHVEEVAIKNFFAITETGIESGVGVGIAYQRYFIAHLQHGITVWICQNPVTPNTFNVTASLSINTQFTQIFAVGPGYQLRADAVGADHRQINLTVGICVQATFAGDLLGAGL